MNELNLNSLLQPIGSPIDKGTPFQSGYDFDSIMDREFIGQVAMRTDSVSTRTIQDLAVTDAKIATLTANKITAGTIDAGVISVINLDADNITSGAINASLINVTNINANNITTGTIDADTIRLKDIDAGEISAGTISADRIGADSITASKIDVSYLSALTSNMGTLTAGLVSGGTVSGALVRSSSGNDRIELVSGDDINFYNSGSLVCQISSNGAGITISSDVYAVGGITTNVSQAAPANDGIYTSTLQTSTIIMNTRSSNPGDDWALYMYDNSGYGLRTKMSDDVWQVDQTAL